VLLKIHLVLLVLIIVPTSAQGFQNSPGPIANEPFAGSGGALNTSAGGGGWAGPWQTQNSSTNVPGYNVATASPLSVSGSSFGNYATGGDNWQSTGRALDITPNGAFAAFLASDGSIGKPGATIFFSIMMRKDVNTEDEMSVTLNPNASSPWWVNTPGIAIGHFGASSDSGGVRYWSMRVAGNVYRTSVPVVVGQAAQLVCSVTFGVKSVVSLYVNPPAAALPATPAATVTTESAVSFRSLEWYAGTVAAESSIDEIRFAGSYATLDGTKTPPPAAPADLSAAPGNGQITLTWAAVPSATAYSVYEVVNGTAQVVATVSSPSAMVTGLVNFASYTFYVEAVAPTGSSGPSSTVTAVPAGPLPVPHPSLGTNLTAVADYGRELPFVDVFRMARTWIPQIQGGNWGAGPSLQLDANGWIKSLQPGQYAETIFLDNALDDHPDFPAGQYTLLYDGEGTIQFDLQSATIVSQTPGRMVVNVDAAQNGVYLMVTATNPNNYLRNIRFIMPGFESTYLTSPFNPQFLKRLNGYKVLRYMEWMLTNGSTVRNWSDRPLPGDYTWTLRGVPLETLIQLANLTGVTPWFNIPAQATDAYVRQFAALVNQQLSPSLRFYLEYSNETWNGSFSQTSWIQAQGLAAGYSTNATIAGFYYTSARSSSIFATVRSVLTTPSRMIRVIASQAANSWLSDQMLAFQNSFANADVLAIAPYFNCDDTATGGFGVLGDPSTAAQVDAMTVDQVINVELAHINGCANQEMVSTAAVARKYGLKMVGYEGGQSLVGYNGAENDTLMTALFKGANRSVRMTALYAQYLANWVAAGGDMFASYSDVCSFTKYGNWGSMEYQDQDPATAPKYQALMTFAAQHP
jgi:hypothetical protein